MCFINYVIRYYNTQYITYKFHTHIIHISKMNIDQNIQKDISKIIDAKYILYDQLLSKLENISNKNNKQNQQNQQGGHTFNLLNKMSNKKKIELRIANLSFDENN